MKIAIVGSRDYPNLKQVSDFVDSLPDGTYVISGGARGVDSAAADRVNHPDNNWRLNLEVFLPDWNRYGKSAGYLRNHGIVNASDKVVAFWDGKSSGTRHTIKLARESGKPVVIYYADGRMENRP